MSSKTLIAPPIPNPIKDEDRENLLCSAIEGGSNYWYFFGEEANRIIYDETERYKKGIPFVDRLWTALKKGAVIPVHDLEDENGEKIGEISLESIYKGEALLLEKYPKHFADIISEDTDATTGDIWFQLAALGELVYG